MKLFSLGAAMTIALMCSCAPKIPLFEKKPPGRMLEPDLVGATSEPVAKDEEAVTLRLLETGARTHIRHRILIREAGGELVEDAVWRWSSAPDRYLETALHMAAASSPNVHLVDTSDARTLSVMLLAFHLESAPDSGGRRIAGVVELRVQDREHILRTEVLEAAEPVAGEPPGNMSEASGRLLHRLAKGCIAAASQ